MELTAIRKIDDARRKRSFKNDSFWIELIKNTYWDNPKKLRHIDNENIKYIIIINSNIVTVWQ